MQATEQSRAVDLHEPVRSLLAQKGHALWSISPEATVYEAIECMSKKHVGALIVERAGHLRGIITERDYARKVILKGRQSRETLVCEVMTADVIFVTPDWTIGECMRLVTSRRIRYLPVMEANRVVGMLSIGDLVNWIITAQEQTILQLHNYIAGAYPG